MTRLQITKFLTSILFAGLMIPLTSASMTPDPVRTVIPVMIQIQSPGPGSQITSPLLLKVHTPCGADGLVNISLMDANNMVLSRQIIRQDCDQGDIADLAVSMYFDVQKEAVPARIVVSIEDRYDRPDALSSVDVNLVAAHSKITPPADSKAVFKILAPTAGSALPVNSITVSGEMLPSGNNPIILEIMTSTGIILGSRQVPVPESSNTEYFPFSVDIPVNEVAERQDVRLIIRQMGDNIPGNIALSSVEFFIEP
jgi:hypothetical protein